MGIWLRIRDRDTSFFLLVAGCGIKRYNKKMPEDKQERPLDELEILRTVFKFLGEGVLVIDRDMRIVMANEEYFAQEHENGSAVGRHCYEVSHRLSKPCYEQGEKCPVKETFEEAKPSSALHTHHAKDGSNIYVSLKTFPIKDSLGRVMFVVETINDVTEKTDATLKLKRKLKELEDFYEMAIGREMKMIELKEEIENLRKELEGSKG